MESKEGPSKLKYELVANLFYAISALSGLTSITSAGFIHDLRAGVDVLWVNRENTRRDIWEDAFLAGESFTMLLSFVALLQAKTFEAKARIKTEQILRG